MIAMQHFVELVFLHIVEVEVGRHKNAPNLPKQAQKSKLDCPFQLRWAFQMYDADDSGNTDFEGEFWKWFLKVNFEGENTKNFFCHI